MNKILVVEDSIESIDYITEVLVKNDFDVMVATNWKQAIFIATNVVPDCILLDICLPEKNGYEICSLLYAQTTTRDIPVVFLSSLNDTASKVEAFNHGGVDFLIKPFEPGELLARIRAHVTISKLKHNLLAANEKLESLVVERTQELIHANAQLRESLSQLEQINVQLDMSNHRYKHITEAVIDYVYTVKITNNRPVETRHSSHCEDILGYTAQEFESNDKLWAAIIHPDDRDRVIEQITVFLERECKTTIEHRVLHKNNAILWVTNTLVPFHDVNGVFIEYFGVIRDITDKKLHNTQLMTAIVETEENERLRFSQELHDGLCPLFSAAKMYVGWIPQVTDTHEIAQMAKKAEDIITLAHVTAREISLSLSPHVLQNYGLVAALQSFFDIITGSKKIRVTFKHNCGRMPFIRETTLYRVVTELANNTIKHAQASIISLSIDESHRKIVVLFRDDGVGFDIANSKRTTGLGLRNIANRVESLGGQLTINSRLHHGTEIKIELSLTD
jgi:PAS domain S-box-containing protein